MKVWSLTTILALCALLLIAACAPASNAVPTAPNPADDSKQIATLYISPTPNDADRAATRSASRPTGSPYDWPVRHEWLVRPPTLCDLGLSARHRLVAFAPRGPQGGRRTCSIRNWRPTAIDRAH